MVTAHAIFVIHLLFLHSWRVYNKRCGIWNRPAYNFKGPRIWTFFVMRPWNSTAEAMNLSCWKPQSLWRNCWTTFADRCPTDSKFFSWRQQHWTPGSREKPSGGTEPLIRPINASAFLQQGWQPVGWGSRAESSRKEGSSTQHVPSGMPSGETSMRMSLGLWQALVILRRILPWRYVHLLRSL